MTTGGMRITALLTAAFAALSCSAMLYRAGTKTILLEDTVHAREETGPAAEEAGEFELKVVKKNRAPGEDMTLVIPVPAGTGSEAVTLEDGYLYRQLTIRIDGCDARLIREKEIESSLGEELISARCVQSDEDGTVKLLFRLGDLLANESSLDSTGGRLVVSFFKPAERYRHVVIVDSADEVTGPELSALIDDRLEKVQDLKVYYTAFPGMAADRDVRLLLMTTSGADMFIQVGSRTGSGVNGISAWYNGQFYIRDFGNVMMADILERNTAQTAGWTAAGLFEEEDSGSLLYRSQVASAFICAGDTEDPEDADRLRDSAYLGRVADGIAAGIQAAAAAMDEGAGVKEEP